MADDKATMHISFHTDVPEQYKASAFLKKIGYRRGAFVTDLIISYLDGLNIDVDNLTKEQAIFLAENVFFMQKTMYGDGPTSFTLNESYIPVPDRSKRRKSSRGAKPKKNDDNDITVKDNKRKSPLSLPKVMQDKDKAEDNKQQPEVISTAPSPAYEEENTETKYLNDRAQERPEPSTETETSQDETEDVSYLDPSILEQMKSFM